ncbi:MAG: peptidoglycan -binding protein [Alphaproteobacteria bacterium]|nr:peptidoglycan -binding protein [Alphaproteobacteria bacterium]
MPGAASRRYSSVNYWPGFVDALAALLVVVVFLIMVFALAQIFLSDALSGRDSVLEQLTSELDELAQMLDLERNANSELRISVAQLSSQLQTSVSERDALVSKLSDIEETLATERRAQVDEIADLNRILNADKESIELQLRDLERLNRDIVALRSVRDELETKVAGMATALRQSEQQLSETRNLVQQREQQLSETRDLVQQSEQQLGQVRDLAKELEAKLADESERTVLAQKEVAQRDIRLAELLRRAETAEQSFSEERTLSEQAQRQVSLLADQLREIRRQLAALNEALEASEVKNKSQNTQIVNLGKRLNAALATRVQELARYRSEFFGRLREVLGNRSDIRIVGDRFVFQSEVLFASGAAELNQAGGDQLGQLAKTLRQISAEIPDGLDWVLRVDGHTDVRPISTAQFPSNWELSSARATSVVKFLIEQGIPPNRLVAAGFGQYQPLDAGDDEIAYRRNRRIEFKLTQR